MGGILAFVPDKDTPGKADVSGAFYPEALKFVRHHGGISADVRRFPSTGPLEQRRAAIAKVLRENGPTLTALAFFCHGFRHGIQAGYTKSTVLSLASFVATRCTTQSHVILYACDTGRDSDEDTQDDRAPGPGGEGGFADALRDACEALNRQTTIVAHTTRGHATTNPHARFFKPGTGGVGGEWFIEPGSRWWPKWRTELYAPFSTLRFRFPFMTPEAIQHELSGPLKVA
jgi:hypothetical protein